MFPSLIEELGSEEDLGETVVERSVLLVSFDVFLGFLEGGRDEDETEREDGRVATCWGDSGNLLD